MKRILLISMMLAFSSVFSYGQEFINISEAFTRSSSYEKENNYKDAAGEIQKIYNKGSYEMNLRLGWLTYLMGSYIESMNYYQAAIDLKPYALEPRFGYIYPASAAGNWTKVEEQYKLILAADPANTYANYWLGVMYYNREDYAAALKLFEKIVNLYPFDYDATIMYAWTNFKMQNLREAKVLFQKALLISPGDESALEGLGLIK